MKTLLSIILLLGTLSACNKTTLIKNDKIRDSITKPIVVIKYISNLKLYKNIPIERKSIYDNDSAFHYWYTIDTILRIDKKKYDIIRTILKC